MAIRSNHGWAVHAGAVRVQLGADRLGEGAPSIRQPQADGSARGEATGLGLGTDDPAGEVAFSLLAHCSRYCGPCQPDASRWRRGG
jgi:hypothetical protein